MITILSIGVIEGAELERGLELYRTGRYEECAGLAEQEVRGNLASEGWSVLKVHSELAQGRYDAAARSLEAALDRLPSSLNLRLLGLVVDRFNGRADRFAASLDEIERQILRSPYRYATPEGRVALGRFFLLRGIDARKVLDQFYDVAIEQRPELIEAYFATAELSLEKQDDALAAESLAKAPEPARGDPHYHYLLARAFVSGDRERATESLAKALEINPRHSESLLLQVDLLIDAERYGDAEEILDRVHEINPHEPRGWAYRAVLAHLANDEAGETTARQNALRYWSANPEVDHIIGRKLSQKYRFAEGSTYQQRALDLDPEYLPARVQLCQDFLRLGREQEGWALADLILQADAYNVVAYNLVTLRDELDGFTTLWGDGLLVRMEPREAELYGSRVVALLEEAKRELCERYDTGVGSPVFIEIFPRRRDFGVRTFGLPGADGLLGVCFGNVITAISPAAQGESPSNWEAVLWHEFCHAVTLNKSRNRMPRWLSEGISVYEEGRRDPSWAAPMNPTFRARLLDETLIPLSELSGAFLTAKTPVDLQFAYFESSLAVEFLVGTAGLDALNGLLDDLGIGKTVNEALPVRTGLSLQELDAAFTRFARQRASQVAPEATWDRPNQVEMASDLSTWVEANPRSFYGLQSLAKQLVTDEDWSAAREVLERLKTLYPEYVGPDNAYMLLAEVHRNLSDPNAERIILEDLLRRQADAVEALLRLTELDEAAGDWESLAKHAQGLLAVNPLIPTPHRRLARAAEALGDRDTAIVANRALTLLDDPDPAALHYRLGRLLHESGRSSEARREVLKALEEAPRFLEAHRLLLDIAELDRPNGESRSPIVGGEGVTP